LLTMQAKQVEESPFFHWPAKVWYPCMAWTNFINRPKKQSTLTLFNQAPQNVETKIEFPRSEFHHQMANKRKERYFWNIIYSIIGWYKVSHRSLICKAEKSKFCVKIWNISHYRQAFGMMQWFIFRYLAWSFCLCKVKRQYNLIWLSLNIWQ
jgi:hypothetical protein